MGKANGRLARRWLFADCVFDEEDWSLFVAGHLVPIETKPLEVLLALLQCAGKVVPKEVLLDQVWPDVTVVEASLTTAVRKLRRALGDDRRKRTIVQTASGIGYRLTVPVDLEDARSLPPAPSTSSNSGLQSPAVDADRRIKPAALFAALLGIGGFLALYLFRPEPNHYSTMTGERKAEYSALRKLDLQAVERLLNEGWDASQAMDNEGNGPLNVLLNNCEWDPSHDKRRMLLIARTLIEAGAEYSTRNVWGDTAYSIAKSPRYCGPEHPVTVMLYRLCSGPPSADPDRCLATYELAMH